MSKSSNERRANRIQNLHDSRSRAVTVKMSRSDIDALLAIDAAVGARDDAHTRPTVHNMAAVTVR